MMSSLIGYHKYENVLGKIDTIIKNADKDLEPPSELTVECRFDPTIGLEIYLDESGNVYKMAPLPPSQAKERPRKGGSPPKMSPKGFPLGFGSKKLLASSGSFQAKNPLELKAKGIPDLNLVPQAKQEHLTLHAKPKALI